MASIRCAHCGQTHGSVSEVRECSQVPVVKMAPAGTHAAIMSRFTPRNESTPAGGTTTLPPAPVAVSEGFWIVEDQNGEAPEHFKIQLSGRSNKLYGKKLEGESFEYFANAPRYVSANWGRKLTVADATWFGKLYGRCMICGRTLENEESIANGIGPICAEKL